MKRFRNLSMCVCLTLMGVLLNSAAGGDRSQALRLVGVGSAEASGPSPEQIKDRQNVIEKELDLRRATAPRRSSPSRAFIRPSSGVTAGAETEANNTFGTANPITLNTGRGIMVAAINPGGDEDWYSFTATAGDTIWAHTDTGGPQNGGATSRDTVLDLVAADGSTIIESDDDDGTGNGCDGTIETGLASLIAGRTVSSTGTYYLHIRAFSASGIVNPYTLFLTVSTGTTGVEVEPNNTSATAQLVYNGTTGVVPGQIEAAGDEDFYGVVISKPGTFSFNVDCDTDRDGAGTDLVVELRDPTGASILLSVDSSITGSLTNPASEGAAFTFSVSGTYFVKVRHFSATGTGTYSLMVAGVGCGLICPANITASNDPNQCGAVVTYPAPTTQAACGTVTCSPASGSFFPVGVTTVTCTTTSGDSCAFTVTVNDTQVPVITCPANVTVSNDPNQCGAVVSYPAPFTADNCPGATTVCTPASGSFFPRGTTTVTCTVTDGSTNTSSCSFTVTVNDTQPPSITCPANQTVFQDSAYGGIANYPAPTTSDNCPGVSLACSPAAGTNFPLGNTTVVCTATDGAGNTATCSFTVTVVPPPSTTGARITGAGGFIVSPGLSNFVITARAGSSTTPSGSLIYRDPALRRLFRSTQVTAVVVTGSNARVFGTGVLQGRRGPVNFVVDLEDNGRVGSRRDRFRLELNTGYAVGPATLRNGDISISSPAP